MKEYNANLPQVFNYMGNEITFLNGESVMINATEMARVFGKEVRQWFANAETHEFIHALADHKGLQPQELPKGGKLTSLNTSTLANAYPSLIMVVKGGIPGSVKQGTWMHEDLAIEFARWLSPKFAIWCNDRIKELMRHGATALNPENLLDPDYVIKVMTALKKERAEKELAQSQVREMTPKALFADAVSTSSDSCLIGELAKILKQNGIEIGQNRLFKWLRSHGYLGVKGEYRNLPTQRALEMGLFEIKKTTINRPDGTILVSSTTKVTGKGQIYFVNKFLRDGGKTIPVSE
jgi:anti-repressor protein